MKKLIAIALIASFGALSALTVQAADKKKEAPAEKKAEKSDRGLPYGGKIGSIDKSAKTIKVGERVFAITATTKIQKAGKPAKLDDATVGDEVGIYYKETDAGKLELISLRVGPKPEKAPKTDDKK